VKKILSGRLQTIAAYKAPTEQLIRGQNVTKYNLLLLLFVLRKRRWPRLQEIRELFVGLQVTGEADTSSEFAFVPLTLI